MPLPSIQETKQVSKDDTGKGGLEGSWGTYGELAAKCYVSLGHPVLLYTLCL